MNQKCRVKLEIYQTDTPNGKPSGPVLTREHDLVLDNLGLILANLFFSYTTTTTSPTWTAKDTGAAPRTLAIWGTAATTLIINPVAAGRGIRVGVGTGVTPAARTDTNLQAIAGALTPTTGATGTWTSAAGIVQVVGSVSLTAGATVTEAGLFLDCDDTAGVLRTIMLLHDVFTGVVIAPLKFAHVVYTFQF